MSDFGNGGNDNDDNVRFKNGNEFLEGLESKHKQNNAIEKAEGKMNYIRSSINNVNNEKEGESVIQKEIMRMESMDLKRMESRVKFALKGPEGNFITRNYKVISLIVLVIILFIMFICI